MDGACPASNASLCPVPSSAPWGPRPPRLLKDGWMVESRYCFWAGIMQEARGARKDHTWLLLMQGPDEVIARVIIVPHDMSLLCWLTSPGCLARQNDDLATRSAVRTRK